MTALDCEVIGAGVRPPIWRTALAIVATALGCLIAFVFSPFGARSTLNSGNETGLYALMVIGGLAVVIGLPLTLAWRHHYPFAVTAAAAIVPLIVPVGPSVALMALSSLLGRRSGPRTSLAIAGVGISTAWIAIADWLAKPRIASFLKSLLGPANGDPRADFPLGPEVPIVAVLLSMGVSVGAGLLLRARRQARAAEDAVSQTKRETEALGDEVARRAERERIAREVHDALGHRLSLINLHAGALEANAADNPKLAESAQQVRLAAVAALDDLRSLLAMLREPLQEQPTIPLTKLSEVVGEAFGTGAPLSSSIFIEDADAADPALSRAVYRIVQELLTNARKHAPGQHVLLDVAGGPNKGVTIDCRNPFAGASTATGSSRGLAGISERAESLGGTVEWGLDEGGRTFRVHVELPWRAGQQR